MQMPGDMPNISALEMALRKQADEIRALRVLLETMNKKLEAVYEITEAKAISFARGDETL
jgi:AmiR/NasT family two-component response regulator